MSPSSNQIRLIAWLCLGISKPSTSSSHLRLLYSSGRMAPGKTQVGADLGLQHPRNTRVSTPSGQLQLRELHWQRERKSMFERGNPFDPLMCLPHALWVALPKTRASARCPGNGFTTLRGLNSMPAKQWETKCVWMTWEWIYSTETGNSTPCLPMGVFTPCSEGGLTNDKSTKQRGRNRSLRTSRGLVSHSLDPVSQVPPGDSCEG